MYFHSVNIGNLKIGYNQPVRVMGVINLSPESFYQQSVVTEPDNLIDVIQKMEIEGVDFFDIGAASTAPASIYSTSAISVDEELSRIKDAMGIIRDSTKLPISIDTTSARVAETALDLGANLVNDISGLSSDKMMAEIVADKEVPVILMSFCDSPCANLEVALHSIKRSLENAKSFGISDDSIIIDPGIGFGKPVDVDFSVLRNLRKFVFLRHPVLVGVSRKAFIGDLLNLQNPAERLIGTIAATSIAVANGANVIRAHDVMEAKMAVKIGESLQDIKSESKDSIELLGICDEKEAEIIIEHIGASPSITKSLSRKALILNILVPELTTSAALIIKQEMLALGGDAAYHHDVIDSQIDSSDLLIMGTPLQLERFSKKMETMGYFGLNRVSDAIKQLLSEHEIVHR